MLVSTVYGSASEEAISASLEEIRTLNLQIPDADGFHYVIWAVVDGWQGYLDLKETELSDGGVAFLQAVDALRAECNGL